MYSQDHGAAQDLPDTASETSCPCHRQGHTGGGGAAGLTLTYEHWHLNAAEQVCTASPLIRLCRGYEYEK